MFFIIRHGERADFTHDDPSTPKVINPVDPPLTPKGHKQAYQTGLFLRQQLQYLNSYDDQQNPKIVQISSPYYRCLQTSKQIALGLGLDNIHQSQLYIEDAIEEWCNSRCKLDETSCHEIFFRQLTPEHNQELFSELTPSTNKFFDYEKNPDFNPQFEESLVNCRKRFLKVYNILSEKSQHEKNQNLIHVICSHGAAITALYGRIDNWHQPDFCALNLIEKDNEKSDLYGKDLYKALISNHYAWKK